MIRLVLLHGFLGCPDMWDPIREELATRSAGVRIETPWLPGHGPHGAAVASTTWDDAIDGFVGATGAEPALWVGYSMGARIALGIAARHPGAIRGLVLVSSHLGLASLAARTRRSAEDQAFARLAEDGGMEALVAAHEARAVLRSQAELPACLREALHARRRDHQPGAVASSIRVMGLGAMPDLRGQLTTLGAPLVAIAGEDDAIYAELAREAAELGGGEAVFVPGAGHDVVLEDPERVAVAIHSAVTRIESGTRPARRATESLP